jgi:hypothetical protein
MICTVHQPNYLPYLGFFEKVSRSDIFILYDTTQFKKNDWQNRNRITTKDGWQWLSIAILHNFGQKIFETKIDHTKKSLKTNWSAIKTIYGKAPFFKKYSGIFEEIYNADYEFVSDLNCRIILAAADILGIKTKFIKSSSLPPITTFSTEALVDLCKLVNADAYISGAEGENYLIPEKFRVAGIKLIFQHYNHPIYNQFNNPAFQPYMSIIDLLFNCGEDSYRILTEKQCY